MPRFLTGPPPPRRRAARRLAPAIGLVGGLLLAAGAAAQTVETGQGAYGALPQGARNGVFVLDADAGRLFAGPRLVVVDPDGTFRYEGDDEAFDPLTAIDPRVFTVDARTTDAGQTVFAGLGFSDTAADAEEPPATAAGFAVSTDGGRTWAGRSPALDADDAVTISFGVSTLDAVPVTAPQGAPPLDLALTPGADTAYVAAAAAGLRRSTDGGATWRRVVLPPDSLVVLDPRQPQSFTVAAQGEVLPDGLSRSAEALNFFAYSVLVAEDGTVWAGTFSGLNRSVALDDADDLAWIRYLDSPFGNAPVGNHVYALEERPRDGTDEVWAACWVSPDERSAPDEEFGVVAWTGDDADGQPVFETRLLGVRVFDLAFDGARAYAASDDGLYIADDADVAEWRAVRVFRGADGAPLPIPEGTGVFAVAVTASDAGPSTVWAGTAEGVLRSTDDGASWTLLRASVPPRPDPLSSFVDPDAPEVDVYAYPNPFTPRTDGFARVRFDLAAADDVTVRVYDFGMRLVRTLDAPARPAGPNEVLWDGLSDRGTRVANGAYVYVVDAGGEQLSGKLLVFE